MTVFHAGRLVAAAILSAAAVAAQAEAPFSFAATPGKLPKDVVPLQYAAHLRPDVSARTFFGSQTVEIEVLKETDTIVLNAADLHIDAATLSGKAIAGRRLTPLLDQQQQTLSFKLGEPLARGRYQLTLKFHGAINREARGLFHLDYKAGKADKTMIATNMAPSDTRRLLPSWDEPAFRASFKLTVDLPSHYKAFSNTPLEKQEKLEGGLQRFSFGLTPKMPSYLLVLVAGELERSTAKQDGTEIGIVTTAGKQSQAAYALKSTKELLRYYNKYFGQPYPLPKLDQIAIPGGFNGAMENWGGIVYEESALLVDPDDSTDSARKLSFAFNSHEVAHQWFGNLVTMAWWDNLWLNEGFASWMEVKAGEHFHPEWRVQLTSQAERDDVMDVDARKTTRAIQAPVTSEEQAADSFDEITYTKGQAFVRMLEAYLGEDAFRKGVRAYMASHRYGNTTSADLWTALEKASGKPVARVAADWTTQPGFPLVSVQQACENGKRRVTLTQQQYWLDEAPSLARLWQVPVEVGTVGGKTTTMLLTGPSATVIQPDCNGTLVIDPAGVGYYRVQYDRASFAALAAQVPRLSDSTRLRLLSDTWSQAQSGRLPLASYTALVAGYANESRPAIWSVIAAQMRALDTMADGAPEQAHVRRFLATLVRPAFARLGWNEREGEPEEQRTLRPLLAALLIRAEDGATLEQARALFASYSRDADSVSPSMVDVVAHAAGLRNDAANYDDLAARLAQADSGAERELLAEALTSIADPVLAARTLQLALSDTLPAQTTSRVVQQVAHAGHIDLAWAFAVRHRDALLKDQEAVARNSLFPSLVSRSSDPAHADMMEAWIKVNFGPDAQAEANKVANEIRTRALHKRRLLPQVGEAMALKAQA